MSRIIDYPVYTECNAPTSDNFIIDSVSAGTKRTRYRDVAIGVQEIYSQIHVQYRKQIYNAINLGETFTEDQNTALSGSSPSFNNLYIGAYWTINGHKYVIADFDYWYNKYDKIYGTNSTNSHHVVLIPMWTSMPTGRMNDTSTTEGGYLNSLMYTENMASVREIIEEDWGDHVVTHRECFTNGTTNGHPTSHAWVDSKCDLMNEAMVYGGYVHSICGNGLNNDRVTIDTNQLAISKLAGSVTRSIGNTWLRDVVDSSHFASTNSYGIAAYDDATAYRIIRPIFAIKAT